MKETKSVHALIQELQRQMELRCKEISKLNARIAKLETKAKIIPEPKQHTEHGA